MSRVLAARSWRDELFGKGGKSFLFSLPPPQPIIAWPVVGGWCRGKANSTSFTQTNRHAHTQREGEIGPEANGQQLQELINNSFRCLLIQDACLLARFLPLVVVFFVVFRFMFFRTAHFGNHPHYTHARIKSVSLDGTSTGYS